MIRKLPIRWQLSLSYAGIALLVAVLLGAIMLTILRRFYIGQEQSYLRQNALTVSMLASRAQQDELRSADMQAHLESFAFIFNARVRLLDTQGQVIVDSGMPPERAAIAVSSVAGNVTDELPVDTLFIAAVPPLTPTLGTTMTTRHFEAWTDNKDAPVLIQSSRGSPVTGWSIAIAGDELPREQMLSTTVRSNQVVVQPYFDAQRNPAGLVELSQGPAYGLNIVNSVAWGWGIAAILAVLVAAGAGWWVSQRFNQPLASLTHTATRMADGDLTARADFTRQDEFGSLAGSFNQMANTIETKVSALRAFVADAAHEIHTPLTALRSNLELNEVEAAILQVERMDTLSRNLLDLSRLEAGEPVEGDVSIDFSSLLRDLAEPYASRAEQAGIKFSLEIVDDPVWVEGNSVQICIVLHNLLDNAIKFTPEDGRVTVRLEQTKRNALRHRSCREHAGARRQAQDGARLTVSDTGIGIPAEDLPRLFSRFHRGRNVSAYPGSGLGLPIVKTIADRHGAEVRVESKPGSTQVVVEF